MHKIFKSSILDHLFKLLLYFHVTLPFLVLYRQVGNLWIGHIWKIVSVYSLILLVSDTIKHKKILTLKVDSLFLLLISLLIFGNISSFFLEEYFFYSYKSQMFAILLWITIYITFKHETINYESMKFFLAKISLLLIVTYSITLLSVYTYFLRQGDFYLGFSSSALIIPFVYYMISKKKLLLLLTIILIFISGKRGVFIMLPFVAIIYMYLSVNIKVFLKVLLYLLAIGLSLFLIVYYSNVAALFESSINKFDLIYQFLLSDDFDMHQLAVMSSGRSIEIVQAINELNNQEAWLRGLGYGFRIEVFSVDGSYSLLNHYVHTSILNFILQYGLILGSLFILIFSFSIVKKFFGFKKRSTLEQFFILLSIGFLLLSLTNYSMSFNPIIWIVFIITIYGFRKKRVGE